MHLKFEMDCPENHSIHYNNDHMKFLHDHMIFFISNRQNIVFKLNFSLLISDEKMEVDEAPKCHHTLEFFEMCAQLITTLAR